MKYIDADRLRAEIERLKIKACGSQATEEEIAAALSSLDLVIRFLDSLQQEQPDLPGIEESGIPGKDFIPVEWVDACEKYGKWKIVQQEQPKFNIPSAGSGAWGTTPPRFKLDVKSVEPEVDFEIEYAKFSNDTDALDYAFPIDLADYKDFARHFYELGRNARKEDK